MIIGSSTINDKGQVTIPKEIRNKLGIMQGEYLIFSLKGDKIIIRKSETNKISEILKNQKPWLDSSIEFQQKTRKEWNNLGDEK